MFKRLKSRHHGQRTAQGAEMNWPRREFPVQYNPVTWVKVLEDHDKLPNGAFVACLMETGEHGYVARGTVDGHLVTGHTTASAGGVAFLPFGTTERQVTRFEVLVAEADGLMWVKSDSGHTPPHSVRGGLDRREQQYIGRTCTKLEEATTWQGMPLPGTSVDGEQRVGKIHKSHRCLYVPYEGSEYIFPQYEVLCHKITPGSLAAVCKWNLHAHFRRLSLSVDELDQLPLPESLRTYLCCRAVNVVLVPAGKMSAQQARLSPMQFPVFLSPVSWKGVPRGSETIPHGAFVSSQMQTGEPVFVARCNLDGQSVTGYTTPVSGGMAHIPYGLQEFHKADYEVMVAKEKDLFWEERQRGQIPPYSVNGGLDRGEQQYIGRTCTALTNGMTREGGFLPANENDHSRMVGKIHRTHGCLYIPYEGQEYVFEQYEVLRHKISPADLASVCKWKLHETLRNLGLGQDAFDCLPIPDPVKTYLKSNSVRHEDQW